MPEPSWDHEHLIRRLGAKTRRFAKALRAAIVAQRIAEYDAIPHEHCEECGTSNCQCYTEAAEAEAIELTEDFRGIPDAYRIEETPQGMDIIVYEVELHHPVSAVKMERYGWLWFCLDYAQPGWRLIVVQVDRYGAEHVRDPAQWYYGALAEEARKE